MLLYTIYQILEVITNVFVMLIIVQFIIGLLLAFNVINTSNQFIVAIYQSINSLLEPVLAPIRRVMPSTGAIDFSPLVLLIGLQVVMIILWNVITATA
ncbi:YggT family protein [Erythrobacter sp. SDW2]|uniref:YggT family protein n=1 Tax=Erythrobacter sp. SDW2 TaxID=2907154 RepID=UPI001F3F7A5C|nr:YggT family protein [Erythrobacter sp. SDW2]UIP07588.1 YggT family protein [Erythrobacter sp. SDW2]